jgi:hypothetical protein
MNQEQKFDRIIKKKVDEAEFPFDEQNWNKLSMQLDAERSVATKRGWGKFLYLGLLFLGITSVSIALYKIQGPLGLKGKLTNAGSKIDNEGSSAQSGKVNAINNSNFNSENSLLAVNNKSNGSEKTLELSSLRDSEINKTSSSANSSNDYSDANSNSKGITDGAASLNTTLGSSEMKNRSENFSSTKNSTNGLNKNNITALGENNLRNGDAGEMNSSARNKTDLAGGVVLEHNVLDRIDSKLPYVFSTRNVKIAAVKLPSWYDDDYRRKGKKKLSFLNAEVGGAYLFGWDSKNGKDAKGLNWYAGVNYGKFINQKIGFSVGSQFYNVGNIKESFYESSKSVYGLGSTSSNTIITTQALFYFSVPVKFYYSINSVHQIGASVNPSFLFSSKNVVENYRLTDGIKSNEITTKTSGIYEGVRLNNVLVSAFYRVKLNKRTYLNTEFLYGVRDIFKNTNSNSYSQKPIGLRVGVQYTLFEK